MHLGANHILFGTPFIDRHLHVFCCGCDQIWIAVELNQQKKGLSLLPFLSSHFSVSSATSESMVTMRSRGQRAGVLDALLANSAELWVFGRIVGICCPCVQDATRAEHLLVFGVLLPRIVEFLGFLFGIQVVEVAEPFVEAVRSRQEFVAIPQMVFPELRCRVADRFQNFGERRVFLLDAARLILGIPTVVIPVRTGSCPMMKAADRRCSSAARSDR